MFEVIIQITRQKRLYYGQPSYKLGYIQIYEQKREIELQGLYDVNETEAPSFPQR